MKVNRQYYFHGNVRRRHGIGDYSKGQTTIPKAVREHLGLKPGGRVKFFLHPDGSVVLLPRLPVSALKGIVKRQSAPVSVDAMTEAAAQGAAQNAQTKPR